MASINTSHHENGGIILYNGEIILLYCDQVTCQLHPNMTAKGRIYLTTHRIVFTAQPINQNDKLKSLTAPFYALFDLGLDQPVFGANYIKGKVRTDSRNNVSPLTQNQFAFKFKFGRGGAIEFGKALSDAAKQAKLIASQTHFDAPPSYSQSAAGQYYQATDSVYQPNYPIGFVLPTQIFNQVPPTNFVYTYDSPPPYPGLQQPNTNTNTYFMAGTSVQAPFLVPNAEYPRDMSIPNYPSYPSYSSQNPQTTIYPNLNQQQPNSSQDQSNIKIPSYEEATKKK